MVNGHSASASEFLAAALQDYNRALIVGSRTYGKGTGQNILPLNPKGSDTSLKSTVLQGGGFVKVTTEKLYRVTGKSVQGDGLVPDIFLPDIFTALDSHENDAAFHLAKDSIVKNTYFKPLPAINRDVLREKSAMRVAASGAFQQLEAMFRKIKDDMQKKDEPSLLTWESYLKQQQENKRDQNIVRKAYESAATLYEVKNNSTETERLRMDEYALPYNIAWSKKLKHDIYLEETFLIISDYIDLSKKP
jgi:carboxyl-terminal processing protease